MKLNSNLLTGSVLVALIAATASVFAADWPQWRGPHRDGISSETGLLTEWPAQGPPLMWKSANVGGGFSGVAVVGDKIFTMGDSSDTSFIYALDAATGKSLWAAKVGKSGGGDGHPGPRCTPAVDGDVVVGLGQFGDLVCLEAATGKERWRKNLARDFAGKMMSSWGFSESPLVDGDRVVCTPGGPQGALLALDRKSGNELWRTKSLTDAAAYCSIIVADLAGKRQYVQMTDASVVGVAPDDGKILWRAARRGRVAVVPTPVVWEDSVFVTSGYGVGCNLFKITSANGAFKAEQVFANTAMVNHHGGVIRLDHYVYGYSDGKGWVCLDLKTGKLVWEEKGKLGKGSIAYADGRFYLRSESGKGTIALIDASPNGYQEHGRFDQPDRSDLNSWPHPVIAEGKLFIRDQGVLLCYKIKS